MRPRLCGRATMSRRDACNCLVVLNTNPQLAGAPASYRPLSAKFTCCCGIRQFASSTCLPRRTRGLSAARYAALVGEVHEFLLLHSPWQTAPLSTTSSCLPNSAFPSWTRSHGGAQSRRCQDCRAAPRRVIATPAMLCGLRSSNWRGYVRCR